MNSNYIQWFGDTTNEDTAVVGGKNASLGEMIRSLAGQNVRVPDGFATTVEAYRRYLGENNLTDALEDQLRKLRRKEQSIEETGSAVRRLFLHGEFPDDVASAITKAYRELGRRYSESGNDGSSGVDVAVRSSATAEDLPEAQLCRTTRNLSQCFRRKKSP
jgi:pyruvate, water dikinase